MRLLYKIFLVFLLNLFILSSLTFALEIDTFSIKTQNGYIIMNCSLKDVPLSELEAVLKHAVALRVKFKIVLFQVRTLYKDQLILVQEVERLVFFNTVKNSYFVQYVGQNTLPQRANSIEKAFQLAGEIKNLPILPIEHLNPQKEYVLRVKAIIRRDTNQWLPIKMLHLPIKILHFIFGGGKIESGWKSIRFKI